MADQPTVALEQHRCTVRVNRGTNPPVEEKAGPWAMKISYPETHD